MLSCYGLTDVGRRRKLNEDTILVGDGVFIICDGMGGHKAGEVASRLATEAIDSFLRRSWVDRELTWPYGYDTRLSHAANRLGTAIKLANRVVFRKAASTEDYTGMGTTAAAAIVPQGTAVMTYAHVGDSRIYLIRRGTITALTRDDSWAALAGDADGGQSEPLRMRNVLTKALGARDDVDFEIAEQPLEPGDTVLLSSDGLTNMLPDGRLLEIVSAHAGDPEKACRELIDQANAEGGRDNISAILAHYAH
jgi:protein phosphatase